MKYSKIFVSMILMIAMMLPMISAAHAIPYREYTQSGPYAKNFIMNFYADETVEFTALENGEIDIVDWPLTKIFYDKWTTTPPYTTDISVVGSGPEYGMYIFDINNNESLPDGRFCVTSDPVIRHAIAHLVDRSNIATVDFEGRAAPLYTPVPFAAISWVNWDCYPAPDGTGLYVHPYSPTDANAILDAAGIVDSDADTIRNYHGGVNVVLDVYYRSDHAYRAAAGLRLITALGLANIGVVAHPINSPGAQLTVMTNKDFHIYTGGWSLGTQPPDTLYSLFTLNGYWHPGKPPNYGRYTDPVGDTLIEDAYYQPDTGSAIQPIKDWQQMFADPDWVPAQPIVANVIFMAHRTEYGNWPGEEAYAGLNFSGIFNLMGRGIGNYVNFWTFMNMRPLGYDAPTDNSSIRWGWKVSEAESLNPIYGSWIWDWSIMGFTYDTLLGGSPFVTTETKPNIAYQWDLGTWNNPDNPDFPVSSYTTFKIRDDIYWHDGVQFTADDFMWMVGSGPTDCVPSLIARGFPYPWWYSNVADIHHVEQVDTWTVKVYFNVRSYLALGWVGGLTLIPKHIWDPLINTGDPTGHLAEPTLTGCGPYKYVSYTPNAGAILVRYDGYHLLRPITVRKTVWTFNSVQYYRLTFTNAWMYDIDVTYQINGGTPVVLTVPKAGGGSYPGAYPVSVDIVAALAGPITVDWDYTYDGTAVSGTGDYTANTIREDVNCDGYVNAKDAIFLGTAFTTTPIDAAWDARCDLKYDGFINAKDAVMLGNYFQWPNWKPA